MSVMTSVQFAKALEEAGVVTDLDSILRIVIDVNPAECVQIYVQRIGDRRLLDVAGILGTMMAEAAPRAVRYWVQIADELLSESDAARGFDQAGLHIAEVGGRVDAYSRMVLVEDSGAPPELEGHQVELTFSRTGDEPPRITERRVVG
jgi:hypothetical protein